jgi:hypothetical protein
LTGNTGNKDSGRRHQYSGAAKSLSEAAEKAEEIAIFLLKRGGGGVA